MRGLVAVGVLLGAPCVGAAERCEARGTSLVIDVKNVKQAHLWLCKAGHTVKDYPVAVGSGGAGKATEGDKRTPIGDYALGAPRPSKEFGTFIPIGYPTAAQRLQGASGGDVGIHGPKRALRWAGRANVWFNWTRGCVAVASDGIIGEIAAFVRAEKPATVHLE